MDHHAWYILTHSGEEYSGVDSFPKPEVREDCKRLVFRVYGQPRMIIVDLERGERLVCKRVNRITISGSTLKEVSPRTAKYVLGKIVDGKEEVLEFAEIR